MYSTFGESVTSNLLLYFQEDEELRIFNKQIEEDRRIIISRSNLIELHKVRTCTVVILIMDADACYDLSVCFTFPCL